MRVSLITAMDYRQKTSFKGGVKAGVKAAQNVMPKVGAGAGAVVLLALTGVQNANKSSENSKDDFQIKNLTDEEFEAKKSEVIAHKDDFKPFKSLYKGDFNKWNVQLFDYMMKNPTEYNDVKYSRMVEQMTNVNDFNLIDNKNGAEVALRMLKMPWFLSNNRYARDFGVTAVALNVNDNKVKDIKLQMLNELDKYKDKKTFSDSQLYAVNKILKDINTNDGLKVALKLLDNLEILNDQNPYSRGLTKDCFEIFSNEKEYADIKLELIDKINSKPELFETPYFKHATAGILSYVTDRKTKDFALKILDNPNLFKSSSFADNLGYILYNFPVNDTKQSSVILNLLDTIDKKPELFKNEKFINDLGQLIYIQKSPYDDTIVRDERPIEIGERNLFLIEKGYYNN